MPIHPGSVITNPLTTSRVTVLEMSAQGWLLEQRCQPNTRPDLAEHLHLMWTETFEIVAGEAFYKLNGQKRAARAGETIVLPPGQSHIHPWNAGSTELVFRQRDDFGGPAPQAAQEVLGVFATTAGLTRDGQGDANGQPRNPLQLAVTLKCLGRYGGYDARLPIPAQKFIAATLGALGEAMGYKAVMAKYVEA
jgi:mannose-6-phosphate isomerase-like protein (cupin superfamily)